MSNQYVIGPNGPTAGSALTAIFQPGRGQDAVTIYNTGTDTCYIDDESPLTPTDGQPLPAGSSLPWDENRPLYIVCPTSTTITISQNTQVGFDAGAIAGQLITQGLAQDIANAISITGAPPIDNLTILVNTSLTNGQNTGIVDVSSYQSIELVLLPDIVNSNQRVDVLWLDALGNGIYVESFFCGTKQAKAMATMTVRGPRMQITAVIAIGTTVGVIAYGSYKAVQYNTWIGQGSLTTDGVIDGTTYEGFQNWSGTIPVGATWNCRFGSVAGLNQLTMRYASNSSVTRVFRLVNFIFGLTTFAGETNLTVVSGQTESELIYLPAVPVELSLQNTHATNTLSFRATLVAARSFSS